MYAVLKKYSERADASTGGMLKGGQGGPRDLRKKKDSPEVAQAKSSAAYIAWAKKGKMEMDIVLRFFKGFDDFRVGTTGASPVLVLMAITCLLLVLEFVRRSRANSD